MRIAFLLGAGVSLPAGMASTEALTKAVLRVDDYIFDTDETFYRATPGELGALSWRDDQPRLGTLLQTLNKHCQDYFDLEKSKKRDENDEDLLSAASKFEQLLWAECENPAIKPSPKAVLEAVPVGRKANYEDLFFAASQLEEHLLEEYENPALEPFAKAVLNDGPVHEREDLRELTGMACNYIRDVVADELRKDPTRLDHLACLVEAVRDQDFESCDIFTLNHDLLIEKVLDREELRFVDGFGVPDGDVAWWEPEVFKQSSPHYFLKLHGSINWDEYDRGLAKTLTSDRNYARTGGGERLTLQARTRVLVGTFNKIRDYSQRPYFDLQATFRRQMEKVDYLMVSGYSFGDKGVNAVLSEWMDASTQSKLLVLHADGDQYLEQARGAVWNLWERFGKARMFTYPSHLIDCAWGVLREQIG